MLRTGQFGEALNRADQYLLNKPRDPQMRFFKGVIQTETGKSNEAIATFLKITEEFPELPEPYNNLAVLYAGQSLYDKARAALEMAIRTNPSYATAHENLGDVYAKMASQAYGKALQLDASNAEVKPKLALIRNLFAAEAKGQAKPVPAAVAPAVAPRVASTPPAPVAVPVTAPAVPVAAAAPVAKPAAASAPVAPAAVAAGPEKEIEAAVHAWAQAWSNKDISAYLASYGENFDPPGNQSRKAWAQERHARIVGKSHISVTLSNLSISAQGGKASARFKQAYSANGLHVSSRKTLDLVKVGSHWVIVKEYTGG